MALSGIGLDSSVLQEYAEFKKDKSSIAFLIFKIEKEKSIVIEEKVMKDDIPALLEKAESDGFRKQPLESDKYAVLRSKLIKSPPRYATIVVEYRTDTAQNKVACISWCSDNAAVKERMLISSTKDAIVKKLDGANGYQASDESDLEYKAVCDGVSKGKAKWN